MRVLLIFPPVSDPTAPYPALPALAGHLGARGYQHVILSDINLRFQRELLTPQFAERARLKILERKRQLETLPLTNILVEDFEESWLSVICKYLLSAQYIDPAMMARFGAQAYDSCIASAQQKKKDSNYVNGVFLNSLSDLEPLRKKIKILNNSGNTPNSNSIRVVAISAWINRRRFRLSGYPINFCPAANEKCPTNIHPGQIKRCDRSCRPGKPFQDLELQNAVFCILDPTENRILAKALDIISRWRTNQDHPEGDAHTLDLKYFSVFFGDAFKNRGRSVHFSTKLAPFENNEHLYNYKNMHGFKYMHVLRGPVEAEFYVLFSDRKMEELFDPAKHKRRFDILNKCLNADKTAMGEFAGKKLLVSKWKRDTFLESVEWVCDYGDIGLHLFADAIDLEVKYDIQEKTYQGEHHRISFDPIPHRTDDAVRLKKTTKGELNAIESATEISLIQNGLVPARRAYILPLHDDRVCGDTDNGTNSSIIGEIHFFSQDLNPKSILYNNRENDISDEIKGIDSKEHADVGIVLDSFRKDVEAQCRKLFPSEDEILGDARKIIDANVLAGDNVQEIAMHLADAVRRSGIAIDALISTLKLCKKACNDNVENTYIKCAILLVKEIPEREHLGVHLMSLANTQGKKAENENSWIQCMRSLKACDSVVVYTKQNPPSQKTKGNQQKPGEGMESYWGPVGVWSMSDALANAKHGYVYQKSFIKEANLSEQTGGIVFSLLAGTGMKIFADGTQIAQVNSRGEWVNRNLRYFIQRAQALPMIARPHEESQQARKKLRINWYNFRNALTAAILSSDHGHGCTFIFASKEKIDKFIEMYKNNIGNFDKMIGSEVSEFGITDGAQKFIGNYDSQVLAGLSWHDGAVLVSEEGEIKRLGFFLSPQLDKESLDPNNPESQKIKMKWGMRHISDCLTVKNLSGLAILTSVSGRITIMDGTEKGLVKVIESDNAASMDIKFIDRKKKAKHKNVAGILTHLR